MDPKSLPSRVLHRDGLMLVIDKPAGVPVHRGPKGGESLEDHFDALRFGLPRSPGLAHRLDRDTSGCLILGRHRKALEQLGALFKHGRIQKLYWAIVEGGPLEDEGLIDLPLARLDQNRGWWMKVDPLGAPSKTVWRVLGRSEETVEAPITWIGFEPLTGRTHQLRVHAAAMGWPIVGDPIYGTRASSVGPPLHLHARRVVIALRKSKEPEIATAPAPAHMMDRLRRCGWREEPTSAPAPSVP